jgi:chromosome segregation ATPase
MPARDIDALVSRYADGPPSESARIVDTPGLKGKLYELANQLTTVQHENEVIRARYLELEDAWQGMIEENKKVQATQDELRATLGESQEASVAKDERIVALTSKIKLLKGRLDVEREAAKAAISNLQTEQLTVGDKNLECDKLRRNTMHLDMVGRKLREDWDDKAFKLTKAEEARDHFKAELGKLAQNYGDLVEKLGLVTMDYAVRTSATMVQGKDGGAELLSTYLNRIYDEQEMTNAKYARVGAINLARQPLQ